MKRMTITLTAIAGLLAVACTQNQRAKNFGGTAKIDIPAGEKLVTATWKDDQLWYLTRKARGGEKAETLTLREHSSLGVLNGTVVFKEH